MSEETIFMIIGIILILAIAGIIIYLLVLLFKNRKSAGRFRSGRGKEDCPLDPYRGKVSAIGKENDEYKAVIIGDEETFSYSRLLDNLKKRQIRPVFFPLSQDDGISLDERLAVAFSAPFLKQDLSIILFILDLDYLGSGYGDIYSLFSWYYHSHRLLCIGSEFSSASLTYPSGGRGVADILTTTPEGADDVKGAFLRDFGPWLEYKFGASRSPMQLRFVDNLPIESPPGEDIFSTTKTVLSDWEKGDHTGQEVFSIPGAGQRLTLSWEQYIKIEDSESPAYIAELFIDGNPLKCVEYYHNESRERNFYTMSDGDGRVCVTELFLIDRDRLKIETPLDDTGHFEIKGVSYTANEDRGEVVVRFAISVNLKNMTARVFRYRGLIVPVQYRM